MHSLKDAELIRTVALPAAGASASTASIDLAATTQAESHFEVEISVPALLNLAEGKTATVTLEDSANDASFAAIAGLAPLEITGGAGGGANAASLRVRLPNSARRHLRATADVEAAGGDNTAASVTLALIF
jgi:hypothetical protein